MQQLLSELLHAGLVLFIMFFGLYCLLYGVQAVRVHPARMLGRMVRAILKGTFVGTFWLIKTLVVAISELIGAVALPSPKTTSSNGAFGTGAFLEGRARRRLLGRGRKHTGLVIDGNRMRISETASFMGCAVIAGSGKGKSTRFVWSNLLSLEHSMIILDPSGELWESCAGYLASQGFQTKLISVSGDVAGSLRFNPLARASTPGDLRQIAEILLSSAYSDKRGESSFWRDGAKNFLVIALRCIKNEKNPAVQHLPSLKKFVDSFGSDGAPLNKIVVSSADDTTMSEWKSFISQPEKIRLGMVATARVALEPFSDPEVCKLMSTDTVEFEKTLRKEKSALFISVPEHQISRYRFFLVLLYSQLFSFAMIKPQPHEQSLFFLLDEFGNAGAIPGFSSLITSLRKRRVSVSILLQSVSQLEKTYGRDDAHTILNGGIGSRLYYAGQDAETAVALEKALGRHGVTIEDESGRRRELSKNLMNADEIRTMPDDQALFIHSNQRPALIRTKPYFKVRRFRKRTQIPPPPLPAGDNGSVQYLKL